MIMIAGVDNYLNVPMETTTFLGAALGFIALLLVLFLYINRKWCFATPGSFPCCDEGTLPAKTVHTIRSRFAYDGNSSSDSEEEILRRLKLQQSCSLHSGQLSRYGAGVLSPLDADPASGFGGLQHVTIGAPGGVGDPEKGGASLVRKESSKKHSHNHQHHHHHNHHRHGSSRDPLAQAERGRIGMPHSSSECSSNSSVESNTGLVGGEKKDRRLILQSAAGRVPISLESPSKENAGDGKKDLGNSNGETVSSNTKYTRVPVQHQDSLEDMPDINSNQDCIVVLSQEPLFDTSDLKSLKSDTGTIGPGPESPTSTSNPNGVLEISLLYDAPMRKMTVHVLQARGIPSRSSGSNSQPPVSGSNPTEVAANAKSSQTTTHTQVRLLMLPSKKQKHKTKIRSGENPQFMESFLLHRVNPEEVNSMGLRIRVYGCERMRRERLIGEAIVSFANIDLELETNLWLPLEPRANSTNNGSTSDLLSLARSDSTGSTTSMQHGGVPELLLGLGYNGTTGRLTVEIVKGSQFRNLALNKVPDTYVKLCLVNSMGQEMARAKTSTRRGQPNPLFKETFIFQVALFQLNDVTLMVSVYAKRNMKRNEMVGWFSLGLNSSGPEENGHWGDMRDAMNPRSELVTRWHVLVDS
ncbi:synaptotagmin-14 [Toxorhynchites rutilus septentrionalis]|uniref:synaptotagmin-14 n=1 Tax=Toxorhynchites rutilus septentrionalis TaxID=329112 RepID=UPI00247A5512|nr:synaptotagmin-14 [Toxorhynchites rutilus septentrionalis]XP_055618722.1 synaptotagmin-14 [Toxorhynchites rutilus septentrionalis]